MVRCRGPGSTMITDGCSSQESSQIKRVSIGIGLRKRPGACCETKESEEDVPGDTHGFSS